MRTAARPGSSATLPSAALADCAVAGALEVIGDRWTIHVLREMFYGFTHFEDFVRRTGASRDILTVRLRKLEAAGVVTRTLYNEHPPRYDYRLTQAGAALSDVVLAMMSWGRQHLEWPDGEPSVWSHDCGVPIDGVLHCSRCGGPAAGHMIPPSVPDSVGDPAAVAL